MEENPPQASLERSARLIDSLVRKLEPVRPLHTVRVYAVCCGVQLAVALIAAKIFGVGLGSLSRLSQPAYLAIVATLAVSSAAATFVAVRSAIPGRGVRHASAVFLLLIPLFLATSVWLSSPWGGTWHGWVQLIANGKACMTRITVVAALPWLASLLILRRLAPVREYATGMFIGLSAFLLGALAVQMVCGVTDTYHLIFAHYLPTAVGAVVIGLISRAVLHRSHRS